MGTTYAYLSFPEDIKTRSWKDWLNAHYSFGEPLHRYKGELQLLNGRLRFSGVDVRTNEEFNLNIHSMDIEQLYYGFDDTFKVQESRSLGMFWKPIRIAFRTEEELQHV
jgi:hypothetical protein